MPRVEVLGHLPSLGVADAVDDEVHRAVDAADFEAGTVVEYATTVRRARRRR
jgi:hypothetical protein